ncbi:MAG: hypothetical protein WBM22_23655, partial [Pseudomonas fluorescens]
RPRWQMAFATVAGVALMIGVVMRSPVPHQEVATTTFSAPQPEAARLAPQAFSAPAPAPMARMAAAPPVQAEVASSMADAPAVKLSKRAPVALPSLEEGLQEIVNLRLAGATKAADEKLLALHERFPEEDLPARLEALQKH